MTRKRGTFDCAYMHTQIMFPCPRLRLYAQQTKAIDCEAS
jgi:hypothetical protein